MDSSDGNVQNPSLCVFSRPRSGRTLTATVIFSCFAVSQVSQESILPTIMQASKSQPEVRLVGGYLPKDQRIRVAREIRKTHFILGDADYGYPTTQHTHYAVQKQDQNPADIEYIKSIQKSHIRMNPKDAKADGISEFKAKYPAHDVSKAAVSLNQAAQADLRRHHFEFGNSSAALVSSTQSAFVPQRSKSDAQLLKDIQQQKQNIRKHNFQFGEQPPLLESVTHHDYGPKTAEGWGAEERLKQFKGDLRTSHFQVGGVSQTYVSTAMKDFNPKEMAARPPAEMHLRKEHFSLGAESRPMASTSHAAFGPKSDGKQQLNEEKLNDLRSSHFILGGDQVSYQPVSHATHTRQQLAATAPIKDVGLRKSHFKLGEDGNTWTTVYQKTHLGKTDGQVRAQRDRNADKASHLTVGTFGAPMVSVNQTAFRPHTTGQPGQLDPALAKDLRTHHFQLGPEAVRYQPISKDYDGAYAKPGVMDDALKKDLRSHHFSYGQEGTALVSRNQVDFQNRQGGPTKMDPALMKNLRGNHFDIGETGHLYGTTEYRGKYHWVQPVPDKGYRFTFD